MHSSAGHTGFCLVHEPETLQQSHRVDNPRNDPFVQQLRNDIAQQQFAQKSKPLKEKLPQGFVDDFSAISWLGHLFIRNRSSEEFMREFNRKLSDCQVEYSYESHVPYARAEMRKWWAYRYPNFCQFLQRFCMYDDYILEIAAQITHDHEFAWKVAGACEVAPAYIRQEARRIENKRAQVAAETRRTQEEQVKIAKQQALLVEQKNGRDAYHAQEQDMRAEEQVWHNLHDVYEPYGAEEQAHLAGRMQAMRDMHDSGVVYGDKTYQLHGDVSRLLTKSGCAVEAYKHCYGNQLQQVIHQECITLLEHATKWSPAQLPICSQDSFVDCVDAAREYNQSGMVAKASQVTDFCWAMIDYGRQIALQIAPYAQTAAREVLNYGGAVVEGGIQGIVIAGQDLINHPAQAALCAVAGEYVLAYQLCKVLYNVLDLSVTAVIDSEKARTRWDEYLAPVNSIIDAINNQEVTLRDAVKAGAALAVGWKVQSKILKGMHKFYSAAKLKAVEYVKNNPLAIPEQFMATPEGFILKHSHENVLLRSSECQSTGSKQIDPKAVYRKIKQSSESCRIIGPLDELKAWEWAEQEYHSIRSLNDDVHQIALHTKIPEFKIARIKRHLFYNQHMLDSGITRLDADPEIARAWNRLYLGDFIVNDIKLLEHEYFESKFEALYNTALRRAHEAAQSVRGGPWLAPVYESER